MVIGLDLHWVGGKPKILSVKEAQDFLNQLNKVSLDLEPPVMERNLCGKAS